MTNLTDRMRTCAAHIVAIDFGANLDGNIKSNLPVRVTLDAADLLIEASNALEKTVTKTELLAELGIPMEVIPPVPAPIPPASTGGTWIAPGGPLPGLKQSGTVSPRACPRCDSRAGKRVYRESNHLMLACPVCAHTWEFKKTAGMTGG